MQPATEEILKEEGILKTEFCLWYKKKLAAHHGNLYLTPQRITFKKNQFMMMGLLGLLLSKFLSGGKFDPDIALSSITRGSKSKFGRAQQIVLEYGDGEKFVFAPDKKEFENWITALGKMGIRIES